MTTAAVVNLGNGAARVTFTAPAAAIHHAIAGSSTPSSATGFNVYQGTSAGKESTTPLNSSRLLATATGYTITGLTTGKKYYFTVKALNAAGEHRPGLARGERHASRGARRPDQPARGIGQRGRAVDVGRTRLDRWRQDHRLQRVRDHDARRRTHRRPGRTRRRWPRRRPGTPPTICSTGSPTTSPYGRRTPSGRALSSNVASVVPGQRARRAEPRRRVPRQGIGRAAVDRAGARPVALRSPASTSTRARRRAVSRRLR